MLLNIYFINNKKLLYENVAGEEYLFFKPGGRDDTNHLDFEIRDERKKTSGTYEAFAKCSKLCRFV